MSGATSDANEPAGDDSATVLQVEPNRVLKQICIAGCKTRAAMEKFLKIGVLHTSVDFLFWKKGKCLFVRVYCDAPRSGARNEYVSEMFGKEILGNVLVVCLESTLYPNRDIDTVISVEAFANKLRLNGKVLPEYREKTFPGRSGDLLHRLQVGYLRHGQKPAVAAAGAAAGAAAEPVRRGGRARKRKVL